MTIGGHFGHCHINEGSWCTCGATSAQPTPPRAWDPPLHLFEHDYCGFYAAETLDEAKALLRKDVGTQIDQDDIDLFEAWDDDQALTIYDEDGKSPETKTAGEWARTANHKGYQFGGEQ